MSSVIRHPGFQRRTFAALAALLVIGAMYIANPARAQAVGASAVAAPVAAPLAAVPVTVPQVPALPPLVTVQPGVPALTPGQMRWQASLDAFAQADREHPPASQGVLFVGSSTIRLWSNLAQDFRQVPVVINRGFGGSTMADCNQFVRQLVTQYKPRHVVVYAGDNDLAEGRTPQQVLESFSSFMRTVRTELPASRITYISIKPSPSRASLMPRIRETNALISHYLSTQQDTGYIDIFTPMLAADGSPRPELFLGDKLHMNDTGYRLWQSIIATHLQLPQIPASNPAPLQTAKVSTSTPPSAAQVAGAR